MPQGGARGQNLGQLRFFFLMESIVFEQQILFRIDSLCDLQPQGLVSPGWGRGSKSRISQNCFLFLAFDRGQNLEHLFFFCFYFS